MTHDEPLAGCAAIHAEIRTKLEYITENHLKHIESDMKELRSDMKTTQRFVVTEAIMIGLALMGLIAKALIG